MGVDIRHYPTPNPFERQIQKFLKTHKTDLIFDIGANTGQFAKQTIQMGYDGRIVSFEPLTAAWNQLVKEASRNRKWAVHERCALGATMGSVDVNISGNSYSSSILPMLETHKAAAKNSDYVGIEGAPMVTLDQVAGQYLDPGCSFLIKIDTQGYEGEILKGGTQTLQAAAGVVCELSLVPLYEGQPLWRDIIDSLDEQGFSLWAIQESFSQPYTGQSLQTDAIFQRKEPSQ